MTSSIKRTFTKIKFGKHFLLYRRFSSSFLPLNYIFFTNILMHLIYFIQIFYRNFSNIFKMKIEVVEANKAFFKRYEDLVFRTEDNGLPDGVSKVYSLSFIVQNSLLFLSYYSILSHTTQHAIFLIIFLKYITLLQ